MASIDKTYITNYDDYKSIIDWCNSIGQVKDEYGNIFSPIDFVRYPNINPNDFLDNKEIILWNTPTWFDIWLIRSKCPFDFIQERLKYQYGEEYDKIINRTSFYDTPYKDDKDTSVTRPLKFINFFGKNIRDKKCRYYIDIRPTEDGDYWDYCSALKVFAPSSVCALHYDDRIKVSFNHKEISFTKKSIVRMIRKWRVPKGYTIFFECVYDINRTWEFRVQVK